VLRSPKLAIADVSSRSSASLENTASSMVRGHCTGSVAVGVGVGACSVGVGVAAGDVGVAAAAGRVGVRVAAADVGVAVAAGVGAGSLPPQPVRSASAITKVSILPVTPILSFCQ